MLAELTIHEFETATLSASKVDAEAGIIHDVSLMSVGEARGHNMFVDTTTLSQVFDVANKAGSIKVKADHGSGVLSTIGYIDNFRMSMDQVVGDLHVYESEPERARIFEIARKNPKHMGMSLEFCGADENKDGKTFARCEEITAVALVSDPAANKSLFQKKRLANNQPESRNINMEAPTKLEEKPEEKTELAETPDLGETLKAILARLDALEKHEADEQEMDESNEKEVPKATDPKDQPAPALDEDEMEDDSKDKEYSKIDAATVKKLAARLGIKLAPSVAPEKAPEAKNFQALVDDKTKEFGGDRNKAMLFCLTNHPKEYSEHRKAFVNPEKR